ncbi:MAG: chaperonin GroEL [Bradyrhizobiaceae bacterium]|nr:chaperonin GroEL [Hyphomicrobiales bacterium]MBV9427243.1 chaperonin GroEL [Bradyrhizobiaceae bacterium]
MSSLVQLPDLVGFFSYSRLDDAHSEGALSNLRFRIFRELSLQLGRNLKLWQDVSAIPEGTLWESEMQKAITESVFFIPIVTPRAVTSKYCRFEFDAFLRREAALGRSNLVFPLLYISVPSLEDEVDWRQDHLLRIIATRQYIDWQRFRHRPFTDPEVAEKIAHFCSSIAGALRQPWSSPERVLNHGEPTVQLRSRLNHDTDLAAVPSEHSRARSSELNMGREKVLKGIDIVARAIRIALGPKGRGVLLAKSSDSPRMTRDGATIVNQVALDDPFERLGSQIMRDLASKVAMVSGDGTKTAVILAEALISSGQRAVTAGANAFRIKRGIELAAQAVVAELERQARKINGLDDITALAANAAYSDNMAGKFMAATVQKIGTQGVAVIEEGSSVETELEIVEGLRFERGYVSHHFITNLTKMDVDLRNPYVLIYEEVLSHAQWLVPWIRAIAESSTSVLIIAKDFEAEVIGLLIKPSEDGLKIAAVKAPGFSAHRAGMLHDIAILTGGQLISEQSNIALELLGKAKRIVVTKDHTTIIDGGGDRNAIQARVQEIKQQLDQTTSSYEGDKLRDRLERLASGVAVIRCGGNSAVEIRELQEHWEKALRATEAAIEEGIVLGGGVALLRSAHVLDNLRPENGDEAAALAMMRNALLQPTYQIARNAGEDGSVVVEKVLNNTSYSFGFDAQLGEYGDMTAKGLIDPTRIVRVAFENAVSTAVQFIVSEPPVANR